MLLALTNKVSNTTFIFLLALPAPFHESVIMLEEVSGLVHHVSAMSGDVTKLQFVDQSVLGRATDMLNKMSKSGPAATRMNKAEKHRYRMV